jgi:hypothetical protein
MKEVDMMQEELGVIHCLSSKEKQLIKFIRELGWGDLKIRIENSQPVLIYEAIKTIRLEEEPAQQRKKLQATRFKNK